MNNNIKKTKKISAIFLATVLIAGTIALASPSFMIAGIAQTQSYYDDRMDNRYNSYEPDYGNDNSYGSIDYGKDDNRDKSKDSNKNIDTNKRKCININLNINGNNAGNISIGNKGQVASAAEGYLGTYSSGGVGYDGERHNDGYKNKKDKDFTCIINNNNINTNFGGGNATDGNVTDPCEECFAQVLNATAFAALELILETRGIDVFVGTTLVEINSFAELCDILENVSGTTLVLVIQQILRTLGIILTPEEFDELVTCIGTALGITIPSTTGPIMR